MTPHVQQDREPIVVAIGSITISRQAARQAVSALDERLRYTRDQAISWAAQAVLDESEAVRQVCEQQVDMRDDIATGLASLVEVLEAVLTASSASRQ